MENRYTYLVRILGNGQKWDIINSLKEMIREIEEIPEEQLDDYVYDDKIISTEVEEKEG